MKGIPMLSRYGFGLLIGGALAGCAGQPDVLPRPNISMPASWQEPVTTETVIDDPWWSAFASTQLDSLQHRALAGGPDLAQASARLQQAEARLRIAGAPRLPQLDVGADTTQAHNAFANGGSSSRDDSAVGLSVRYELDPWGRIAAAVTAAEADVSAGVADYMAARLSLTTAVADTYFQWLSLRQRYTIATGNLDTAQRVLELVRARVRHGAEAPLDELRQRTTVLTQRAALEPLQRELRATHSGLAILLGETPQDFDLRPESVDHLVVPDTSPVRPAQLLTRRPDLIAAEARLAAAHANLHAARSAWLPALNLSASADFSGHGLFDLTDPDRLLALGLSLSQTIFNGGRVNGAIEQADARQMELLENYRAAILRALADVENALAAIRHSAREEQLQREVLEASSRALELAERRYRAGADTLLDVLDAQRTRFQAEDQLAQLRLTRLRAALALYQAVGGSGQTAPYDLQHAPRARAAKAISISGK